MIECTMMLGHEMEELRDGVEFLHRLATLIRLVAALDSKSTQSWWDIGEHEKKRQLLND